MKLMPKKQSQAQAIPFHAPYAAMKYDQKIQKDLKYVDPSVNLRGEAVTSFSSCPKLFNFKAQPL